YALIIDHGSRIRRIASLAPSFVVIVGWRMIYNSLGYGAADSGFVIDPGREPMRYMQAVLERAPVLFAAQWGPTPAELVSAFSGYAGRCYLLVAVLFLVLIVVAFLPLLRKNRVARYWFVATIGAFGVMAQFIGGLFAKQDWVPGYRFWRVPAWMICATLIFIHVGFTAVSRARTPRMTSFFFEKFYSTVEVDPSVDLTDKTLVVVNAPNPFLFLGMPALRAYENEPLPDRTRVLAPGFGPLKFTRTGEKTLLVEAQAGNIMSVDKSRRDFKPHFAYFCAHFNSLFRPHDMPFEVGQKTELTGMSAEVVAVDADGQPTKVLFDFAVSLDNPALVWFQWTWKNGLGSYSKFEIPAIGEESQTNGPFGDI
ncbi:MAG: hypothetical protein ACYSWQ_20775, partial [Planctomycetota bacterium]